MSRESEVLSEAVRKAADIVMNGDRTAKDKSTAVGTYDVVTGSDVLAENFIIDSIKAAFPDDTIISEETNPDAEMSDRCWAIDPIDGTMNYSRGIPFFGIQGVFMEKGVPKASAIYLPVFDEMFTADENGAFLNGEPVRTSDPRPLRECLVSTGDFSRKKQEFRDAQGVLFSQCYPMIARFKVFGAACTDFAYLSCGRTDIHIRFLNRIWDFMPGLFLAEKAGAVYDKEIADEYGILVLCSSGEVLAEARCSILPKLISCFRPS